eukprot:1144527-Pelagomonas_calceolata.AAC.3
MMSVANAGFHVTALECARLTVDGVSSIGALDFRMDDWGVDVAVTGSQKAMSLPTGLAYVAASKKGWVWGSREVKQWLFV